MQTEPIIILLFLIASIVAIAARRLRLPYTVSLVLVGLGLGALQLVQAPPLTSDVLFMIFLPGLIFEAAFNIRFANLWRDRLAVLGLAIPGVAIGIGLTAAVLVLFSEGFNSVLGPHIQRADWALALVFGAAVAATDPIAVVALFRRLGAPPRLTLLLEGESLLNDGTAIVFFGLVLAFLNHQATTAQSLISEFGRVVGGGLFVGGVTGLLTSLIMRRIDDAMIEITLTTVAAYGSFLLAAQLGFSGVISTVTAGLICGNYAARNTLSPSGLVSIRNFWEYLGFALNSLVFLLMGFEIHIAALLAAWPLILLSWLAVTLVRGLIVAAVQFWLRFTATPIPAKWGLVLTWGGLRGALSMVLALSLPEHLPARDLIVNLVFGFVLLSILVQGLTMTTLLRRLGLIGDTRRNRYELARMRLRLVADARLEIKRLREDSLFDTGTLDALEREYEEEARHSQTQLAAIEVDPELRRREDWTQLRRHMLLFEQNRLAYARQEGSISAASYEQLHADLDARFVRVETGGRTMPAAAGATAPEAERGAQ